MKLCLLGAKYPPDTGGLAVSTRRLALGLSGRGHAVTVSWLDPSVSPGAVQLGMDGEVQLLRVGMARRAVDSQAALFDAIVARPPTHRFELLHAFYLAGPAFVAVYAARYLGIVSVVSARGNDLDRCLFDPSQFAAIAWALEQATATTTVTADLARRARAAVPSCNPSVVPNGVDTAHFTPAPPSAELRNRCGLGAGPIVAFFGEARIKKGLSVLLRAWGDFCHQRRDCPQLLLVGGVRDADLDCVRVFRRQHPEASVQVVPQVDHRQLPQYYQLADIVALPSLHDGLPNALLEAMACARPIITTPVGGMLDAIEDRKQALLVSPGDPEQLAAAFTELLDNPGLCAQLGRAARQRVLNEYRPERELEANLGIYQRLLDRS